MSELYQDLMIQQQEENERKRRILLEQEEKLAAEILRFVCGFSLILSESIVRSSPLRDSHTRQTSRRSHQETGVDSSYH